VVNVTRVLADSLWEQAEAEAGRPLSRKDALNAHVETVARRLASGEGEELWKKLIGQLSHVWKYSLRNLILQWLQAPGSRLVASMAALDAIAKEQGHEAIQFGPKGKQWTQYTMKRKGAKKVCILMPVIRDVPVTEEDEETGGTRTFIVPRVVDFRETQSWAAEDIIYADTRRPFEVPDLRCPVQDEGLWQALNDFCRHKRIEVRQEALGGAYGVSHKGPSDSMRWIRGRSRSAPSPTRSPTNSCALRRRGPTPRPRTARGTPN
jgi:hypothetical protein